MNNNEEIKNKTYGITTKDKIGYALGDVGSLLVFGLANTFLQVFYTESLGITPLIVMLVMIIARIWDAVNDPLWGKIVDNAPCKKKGTRYKRWLIYLCLPLAVSAVIMFINVKSLGFSMGASIAYVSFSYILFGMLYTGVNIPYGSMASVITTDDKERNSLSVFRSVGSTLGAFGPMILSFLCYDKVLDASGAKQSILNPNKLLIGVAVLALLSIVAFILCNKISKERVVVELDSRQKSNTRKVIKNLVSTKSFVIISIVGMLFLAAQMFQTTYNSYVFMKFFKSGGMAAITQVCQYLPVAVVMVFAGKLVKKFGRKEICAMGLLFSAISFGALALIPITVVDRNVLMYLFFVFSLLNGIGNSFIFLMIWALANDAVDDYFVRTKSHDEGTAYSIFIFMRKLGQTLAAIIVNISLISLGYGKNGELNFLPTEAQATSMYYQSIIIPAVLSLAMFILLWFIYPLNKKRVIELQEQKKLIYESEIVSSQEEKSDVDKGESDE